MITIIIGELEEGLFTDSEDMHNVWQAIHTELKSVKFLSPFHTGYEINISQSRIAINFKGIVAQQEAMHYIVRQLDEILERINLFNICNVKAAKNTTYVDDRILTLEMFQPKDTKNSHLLKGFLKDDEIPEKYKCALTMQIMDEPVYANTNPNIMYNKEHLLYWIYSKEKINDIYNTIKIESITINNELKGEINIFVKEKMITGLREKKRIENEKVAIVNKYTSATVTQANIEKSFRSAAAMDNVDDLSFLYKVNNELDANIQDDNPIRRKNALHWAVEKGSVECVKFLLAIEAKTNIPDAQNKTALDYAKSSNNPEIRNLLLLENDLINLPANIMKVGFK